MVEKPDLIEDKIRRFFDLVKEHYPVKGMILYGSYAKGRAGDQSDIDVGVVIDLPDHRRRIETTADLFHYAGEIDPSIEPKCIFWDEFRNPEKASILAEIIRTGRSVV